MPSQISNLKFGSIGCIYQMNKLPNFSDINALLLNIDSTQIKVIENKI